MQLEWLHEAKYPWPIGLRRADMLPCVGGLGLDPQHLFPFLFFPFSRFLFTPQFTRFILPTRNLATPMGILFTLPFKPDSLPIYTSLPVILGFVTRCFPPFLGLFTHLHPTVSKLLELGGLGVRALLPCLLCFFPH